VKRGGLRIFDWKRFQPWPERSEDGRRQRELRNIWKHQSVSSECGAYAAHRACSRSFSETPGRGEDRGQVVPWTVWNRLFQPLWELRAGAFARHGRGISLCRMNRKGRFQRLSRLKPRLRAMAASSRHSVRANRAVSRSKHEARGRFFGCSLASRAGARRSRGRFMALAKRHSEVGGRPGGCFS